MRVRFLFLHSSFAVLAASSASAQSTCASAIDLSSEQVPQAFVVENAPGATGATVSCAIGEGDGPDVWVRLPDLVVGQRYVVTTSAAGAETVEDTRLAVLLGACGSATEVACSEDMGDYPYGAVEFEALQTGPYYALSETLFPEQIGTWLFTVQEASAAPAGFGCNSPTSLVDHELPLEVLVDMTDGFDERGVSCAADNGGADAWFLLPALPDGEVAVVAASAGTGAGTPEVRLEVFAGNDCSMLSPVACSDGDPIGFVADGTEQYLLFVEYADAARSGPFDLSIETIPAPAGPFCSNAEDMSGSAFPITRIVDLDPTPSFATADCISGATGPERWFALPPLDAGNLYTLSLADGVAAPGNAALQLFRGGDCSTLVPFACSAEGDEAGGPIAIDFVPDAGDTFFALVDAIDPEGDLETTLTLSTAGPAAPPENDLCETAFSFSSGDLPFEHTVGVLGADDTGSYVPAGAPAGGADVFYAFTVGATGRYRIAASFAGEGTEIALAAWGGADCGALVPLCGGPASGPAPSIDIDLQDRALCYITIDDPDPSSPPSSYTLTVEQLGVGTPSPNADCASAIDASSLPFADTQDPTWNTSALDIGTELGFPGCLGELYYSITSPVDATVQVQIDSVDGTGGLVALYTGGCAAPVLAQGPWIGTALLDLEAGVEAVIVVEPLHGGAGALTVEFADIPLPENQTCATATAIVDLPHDELAEFVNARDEGTDGSCAADQRAAGRRDLFWTFTPPTAGNYRIRAIPGDPDNFPVDASVAVFTGACGNLEELACRDFTLSGEQLAVDLAAGVPVTIMVEVAEPDQIPESQPVQLSLSAVPPATGHDTCENAQAVDIGGGPFEETIDTAGNNPLSFLFDGPAHIYRLAAPGDGTFHVHGMPGTPGFDLALAAISDDCDAPFRRFFAGRYEDAVANGNGPASKGTDGSESLEVPVLDGESLLLHVFSATPHGGQVDMTIAFEPKIVLGEDYWMLR